MKKIILSIMMLCCMTAAWAEGSGDGTKEHPYTGEWQANDLLPKLKEGDHLAYDCLIKQGSISVYDDQFGNATIIPNWVDWAVSYAIGDNPIELYKVYCHFNSLETRKNQTFIITRLNRLNNTTIYIFGHYSGYYDGGEGTKEKPYRGEWTIYELYDKLEDGVHLALDCVIKCDGDYISVKDTRLNQEVASMWSAWSPGNFIGDTNPGGPYTQYGKDNPLDNRKGQTFVVTDKDTSFGNTATFHIIGHFTGFYTTTDADGFVYVESAEQMKIILGGNSNVNANTRAKIKLTDDIYLTDIAVGTFCDTFYGTLDGDGHTIHGSHDGTRENKTYLFTNSDGATFKNLNFYNIRIDNRKNHNQAVIASQAKNGCVFENITFDHISTYVGDSHDNTGAVVGYATTNCTFKNITVKNSDFTADNNQSGTVVGHAKNCTFENIKVEHCESTSRNSYTGGVAGRTDDCTISNVEILGTFIKTEERYGGGVVGYSTNTHFTNCVVDDQSCVCVDGELISGSYYAADAGGIVGCLEEGSFKNCINSALIAVDGGWIGGIAGDARESSSFEDCLNTGMVISMDMDDVEGGFYNKYKTKSGLACVTKTYKGKEYVIRKHEAVGSDSYMGGIVGEAGFSTIYRCANLGSVYSKDDDYIGGIVGQFWYGILTNCLSDFHAGRYTNAICGTVGNSLGDECFIDHCLNMTTYKDFSAYDNVWVGFKGRDNYSLTTNEDAHNIIRTTADKIKYGEVCYLLGGNWEQNLGTDPYPTPTGSMKGVYHTRKVSNQYGTVCLPFSVESNDSISYYSLSRKEEDGEGIKLVFTYNEDSILEGTPLLFRSAKAKDADADNPVEICFNNWRQNFTTIPRNKTFDAGFWDLWGTFEQRVFDGDLAKHIYYVSGGVIKNAKKTTIAPYRAWIYGESIDDLTGNGASQAKAIRFIVEDENGEVDALQLIGDDLVPVQRNGKTYSLMGTAVDDSYRGIVIRNGKKYIAK